MSKIENPKVFISYSWTSDDYVEKVKDFANSLRKNGIDVLFDKFNLKPGNEMNDFMEKCVSDPGVTNVLMLLNPLYKEKADKRVGGAGKETQIISEEVYNNNNNLKYIPIIFDLGGKTITDVIPIYLKSRFFIDLSDEINKTSNFMNLIKHLFGVEQYQEAPLGQKPNWVDEVYVESANLSLAIEQTKNAKTEELSEHEIHEFFNSIIEQLKGIKYKELIANQNVDGIKIILKDQLDIRNSFVEFISLFYYEKSIIASCIDFFEKIDEFKSSFYNDERNINDLISMFEHELLIYLVSIMLKNHKFSNISALLNKSYLSHDISRADKVVGIREFFYCRSYGFLDSFIQKTLYPNNPRLLSATAHYWINNIYEKRVSQYDFIDADILITNLDIYFTNGKLSPWFALSYCYGDGLYYHSQFKDIALSLESKTLATNLLPLFSTNDLETLKKKFTCFDAFKQKWANSGYGYSNSPYQIPLLVDYIKIDKIISKP